MSKKQPKKELKPAKSVTVIETQYPNNLGINAYKRVNGHATAKMIRKFKDKAWDKLKRTEVFLAPPGKPRFSGRPR